MSQKFFTLLHGDELRAAPQKKIIPQKEFSSLLDASEVLDFVKKDEKKYRLEVAQECEEIKENAFKEGYEDGYKQWAEQLADFEVRLEAFRKEFQQMIVPVALKAAKKIVGREIELSPDTIVDIVSSQLKAVVQHKKITIYVNKKELEEIEKQKSKLKDLFEHVESFSVRSRDDIAPGGCIIETEIGIINAQIDHRWEILEKAFTMLLKTAPEIIKKTEGSHENT